MFRPVEVTGTYQHGHWVVQSTVAASLLWVRERPTPPHTDFKAPSDSLIAAFRVKTRKRDSIRHAALDSRRRRSVPS